MMTIKRQAPALQSVSSIIISVPTGTGVSVSYEWIHAKLRAAARPDGCALLIRRNLTASSKNHDT